MKNSLCYIDNAWERKLKSTDIIQSANIPFTVGDLIFMSKKGKAKTQKKSKANDNATPKYVTYTHLITIFSSSALLICTILIFIYSGIIGLNERFDKMNERYNMAILINTYDSGMTDANSPMALTEKGRKFLNDEKCFTERLTQSLQTFPDAVPETILYQVIKLYPQEELEALLHKYDIRTEHLLSIVVAYMNEKEK